MQRVSLIECVLGTRVMRLVATGGRAQSDDEEAGEGQAKGQAKDAAAARRAAAPGKRKGKEDDELDDAPAGIFCPRARVCLRACVPARVRALTVARARAC